MNREDALKKIKKCLALSRSANEHGLWYGDELAITLTAKPDTMVSARNVAMPDDRIV